MCNFLDGVLGVVGVAHEPEMFPDDFFAGTRVEAGEVRVECSPALDAGGVFVAEGDSCATERVRDDDFGFRADAHARAREEFRGVDFEGLTRVGVVLPYLYKFAVGFAHGRHQGAAARMQFGVGVVKCAWIVIGEEVVDGGNLFFENCRRRPVVVALCNGGRLAQILFAKVCSFCVAGIGDNIVLERVLASIYSEIPAGFFCFLNLR